MSVTSDESSVTDTTTVTEYEPMFHVLSRFLQTDDGQNITSVLSNLCKEVAALNVALATAKSTASPCKCTCKCTDDKKE